MTKITFVDPSKHKYQATYGDNLYSRPKYRRSNKIADPSKVFLRKKPLLTSHRTLSRSIIRSTIKSLAALYQSLSPTNKDTWTTYTSQLPACNSAWKSFLKINSQLLLPTIPGITALICISSPHQNPDQPICFASVLLTETAQICVSWNNNYGASIYIELFRWIPPGVRRESSQPMFFLNHELASVEHITFSVDEQDVPRENQLFIRALNLRGEVSPFAPFDPIRKTEMRAGRYGYSSYGYAHYQS